MAKIPCIPQARIFTLKETGETMSYDQVRQYLMSNPELWSGKGEQKAEGKKADPVLAALEKGKIKGVAGMNAALWNTAIDTIKAAYIAGKSLAEAINAGIAYLKSKGEDVSQYQDALDDIRKAEKPRVATFFSGAGTMEAALPESESVMAVEYSPTYMKAYNDAFGTKYEARDVTQIDPQEVKAANPDIFHASPVCKNFSKAKSFNIVRKQDMDSAESVARVIREAQPPVVTIENVPDYQKYAPFNVIIEALKDAGYTYDVGVYNAADYGGVQNRRRLLVRAVKDGKLPALPEKQKPGDWYKALKDLIDDAPNTKFVPKSKEEHWEVERINKMIEDGRLDASKPILTMGASAFKDQAAAANSGGPSYTLLSSSNAVPRIIMPDGRVKRVTPEMMKRLMDLPLSYPVPADAKVAKEVLGNGMDGAFTKALIEPLIKANKPDRIEKYLQGLLDETKNVTGLNAALYSGAVKAMLSTYRAVKDVAKAIQAGVDYLVSMKMSEEEARAEMDKLAAGLKAFQTGKAIKKAAGIKKEVKNKVQKFIDKAFAIGVGEGYRTGFTRGATEGGRAGFIAGKEVGLQQGTERGFTRGATEGMRAGAIEGRAQAVDMLRNALSSLSGELTPKQISAIVEKMGRLKTFSETAKQNFIDYANKVIEDANYAAKEKKATGIKAAIKQMSKRKNIPANDQNLYRAFSSLSVPHMDGATLDQYIQFGEQIKDKGLQPGDRNQISQFIDAAQEAQDALVAERGERLRAGRLRNLEEEFNTLQSEGNLPPGITTLEQYIESKKPAPRANTKETKIQAIQDRLNEIPEGQETLIDKLRTLDLSVLSMEDLALIDNALYNYIDTGNLYGIGDPVVKAEFLGRVNEAIQQGVKARRQVDKRDAKILGLGSLFSVLGATRGVSAKLRGLLIQPWLAAATKTNTKYIEIEAAIMKMADKLKINQESWNRIDLFGFLNEAEDNPELFEKLKEQKLSDLETLREQVEKNKAQKDISLSAKEQLSAYNALKGAIESMGLNEGSTLQTVKDKLTDNEKALYDETRKYLDIYSPPALRNMELYGNVVVGLTKNYWPRTTNKINERSTERVDTFNLYGSEFIGKKMFGREKGRSQLIGKSGYYTPVGQENYFNGLKETMLIAEAAHEYHGMQALYNNPDKGFAQLIKGRGAGDIKKLLVDWIMDTKNIGRYRSGSAQMTQEILGEIRKGFTGALIDNPTQVIKQPTALLVTLSRAPKATIQALGIIAQAMVSGANSPLGKAVNGLFKETTIGSRLSLPEIVDITEKYATDRNKTIGNIREVFKWVNTALGGKLLGPVDAFVSRVATLAGYIQHIESKGEEFNIFDQAAKGYDIDAAAAGDQMQSVTNNENAAIYFSKFQLDNKALFFLGNFQANAVRNLYGDIRKVVSSTSKEEFKEGMQGIAGYGLSTAAFIYAGMLSSQMMQYAALSIYQTIMNELGDTEDDEEEKKRIKEFIKSKTDLAVERKFASEVIGFLTGAYGSMARAAAEMFAAEIEKEYYKTTTKKEKPDENIFFAPDAIGYSGLIADNLVSPVKEVGKSEEPVTEAMVQTSLLAAKMLGQSAIAFYMQNLLRTKKIIEKEKKESKRQIQERIEERAIDKKFAKLDEPFLESVKTGDIQKAKDIFNSMAEKTKRQKRAIAYDLRNRMFKDELMPSNISNEDEKISYYRYIFTGDGGNRKIQKTPIKDLISEQERLAMLTRYRKEYKNLNPIVDDLNKSIKLVDRQNKPIDWGNTGWINKFKKYQKKEAEAK